MHRSQLVFLTLCSFGLVVGEASQVRAQQEVGFIEKFATASDRRTALKELIPGTEDYFYYHCLHYQNEKQLAEAQAVLNQWKAKYGETANASRMTARQMLLAYDTAPETTLKFLRERLGVQLEHGPPNRDRAAALASRLDPKRLSPESLLQAAIASDRSLSQVATRALPLLVDRELAPDQLRAWLQRLDRADVAGLVKRMADELALQDSPGFGWAAIHQRLTLNQLIELAKLSPKLLGHEPFIRAYLARLAPPSDVQLDDAREQRLYLERMLRFVRTLPPSQNNLKALVLGNLLRLNLREGKIDRTLFLEYLALPRQAPYYAMQQFRDQPVTVVDLNFAMSPQVLLPPVADDSALVQRYLEHFFQSEDKRDDFAKFLNRDYLERVLAETKILYGSDEPSVWYAKLSPGEQKALRERVELRFGPRNQAHFAAGDTAELSLELKNVPQLLVKIYQVNPRNYYRTFNRPLTTDIDLDGLVANAQRQFDYSQPADRRHTETFTLPELEGRGAWVIDMLGGGQRSRALIQKGSLTSLHQLTDLGHSLQVFDDAGKAVTSAHVEMGDRAFEGDSQGRILIPYSESAKTQNILLVDGEFAVQQQLPLQSESYQLQARFIIDRQALVAGIQASVLIRTRLECNGRPTGLQLLEKPQLTIGATDLDGIATTQTTSELTLTDNGELVHKFLVPQRLANIQFTLSGRVYNQSRDERQDVSATESIVCNDNLRTSLIGSFYLRQLPEGYRVLVLGRNGEPMAKLPVTLSFTALDVTTVQSLTLATDGEGVLELGSLPRIVSMSLTAQGVQPTTFTLERPIRSWPGVVHVSTKAPIVLPLGAESEEQTTFTLQEIRRGVPYREVNKNLKIGDGSLSIAGLSAGDYQLQDHRFGTTTSVVVVDALEESDAHLIGATRALEVARRQPVVITEASVNDQAIFIKLAGSDAYTRVHVIADPFVPDLAPLEQARMPYPPLSEQTRRRATSFYIDSLQLDEEYSYILQRQQATKYSGNLLPQPSLLVHPWEISLTDNLSEEARGGDAIPSRSDPANQAPAPMALGVDRPTTQALTATSYDFLAMGTLIAANQQPNDQGELSIPLKNLAGYTTVTVLAVHPTTADARQVSLPETPLRKRDLRLKEAFDADQHLAEMQSVRALEAKKKVAVGDARTSRVQLYTTLADVYRLYGTLLNNNAEWEKFRFVTQWPELSDEEKRDRYSEMSCHELDYFLYRNDRKFFDAVVAPLVAQKLDKQLVDLWLLDKPLEGYRSLWRIERLNTLERVLLAQRLEEVTGGTKRWLNEYLAAHPVDPVARSQRFETALRGTLLDVTTGKQLMMLDQLGDIRGEAEGGRMGGAFSGAGGMVGGGMGMGGYGDASSAKASAAAPADGLASLAIEAHLEQAEDKAAKKLAESESVKANNSAYFFGAERIDRANRESPSRRGRFFQMLDQTREWAETQFYRVRLQDQTPQLIPPSPYWYELLQNGRDENFLSKNLDMPVGSINEALLALAVLDLPFESAQPEMAVENDRLVVSSQQPAIAYVQSIEPAEAGDTNSSILVGQDIYISEPHTDEESNRPLQSQPLLIGVPYRASIVVTNPSSTRKRVQVLFQLPAGAIPLSTSKVTKSTPVELNPYSTAQVQYNFYFPIAGEFEHYGSQVSSDGKHLVATASEELRVLAEPEIVDETTWSYVADWGTNDQVLAYLQKANLQRLDVSRIAFRMHDKAFYQSIIALLDRSQRFDPVLWGYALKHNDADNLMQLLQQRRDFTAGLGPALRTRLITLDPREQMSYEHLDYKPLVVARIHQLGAKRLVLNDKLFTHYTRLLDVIAHHPQVSDDQRMELCYYLLLQNRIDESLRWFDQVEVDNLATRLQYDYFAAYLDFFRGEYERADQIATRYAEYPVPRWRELFAQIGDHVQQRDALSSGQEITSVTSLDSAMERDDRMLTDRRGAQQTRQAAESPGLDLNIADGVASVHYRNLDEIRVNYYLMDIELLFSRNPFVAQSDNRLPAIRPNVTETIKLPGGAAGMRQLELPQEVRNRNVLIEVTAKGLSRSSVLTANSLAITVVEPYGRVQVRAQADRAPVEAAYVKVYARHQDGSIRFFKDGYTDLRGQFDYATLSTGDLNTAARLSILVIDSQRGATVREAAPPTR